MFAFATCSKHSGVKLKKSHDANLRLQSEMVHKRTLSHSPTGAVSFSLHYTELHLLRRGQIAPF